MLGAPKKCAKCDKQVYPIEELKCLDKVWHKICFKCTVCNSLLNMKNYKGFEKMPYCFVHYPQQKHTAVSDNPEMLRIKENTKIQSNAKYHEDFEKSKGNYTVVADDPETRRILENTKNISQVRYHEDFEKNIKNKYTPVIDSPETTRAIENQKLVSSVEYKGIKNQTSSNSLSNQQQQQTVSSPSTNTSTTSTNGTSGGTLIASFKAGEKQLIETQSQRRIGSIVDYDPLNIETNNNKKGVYNNNILNKQYIYETKSNSTTNGKTNGHQQQNLDNNNNKQQQQQQQQYHYDFMNDIKTTVYKAIYDYDAKEDDEISFRDGDKFINCEQIDIGWMIGVHEKTGKHGMFPSNYAEAIDLF